MTSFTESMAKRYHSFLGTQDIPREARNLFNKYILLSVIWSFIGSLSATFLVLFLIDALGFAYAGVILAIMSAVQLVTDYPSGSLGDWIGQRTVLSIAFLLFATGFVFLSIAETFTTFLIAAVLFGLGQGQASGTAETWLDNNYKIAVEDKDPNRITYGFATARTGSILRFVNASAFITGGILATLISRQFVFLIEAALTAPSLLIVIKLMKNIDIPHQKDEPETKPQLKQYLHFLKGGIKFLFSSKTAFFFLTGLAFMFASFNIWGSLFLFPIYFGYTGTDALASVLRTTIFLLGIPIGIFVARVSQKMSTDKLAYIYLPTFLIYFPGFIILTTLVPLTNTLNIIGIISTIALLIFTASFLFNLAETLRFRKMVDLIPSEFRNSVYSLIPTMLNIISIPLLPIAGILTETNGLPIGLLVPLATSVIGSTFMIVSLHYKNKTNDMNNQKPD